MNSTTDQRFERTRTLLGETQKFAERLLNALHDERNALRDTDSNALAACAGRKKVHLAALERLGHERKAMLAASQTADTVQGMNAYIQSLDSTGTLEAAWSKVIALLSECREANNANGIIITAQNRQNQEALRVMRGDQGEAELETYSPDGKTETTGQYRALAEV
ncbi:MAG: flagellar protein FlgN [Pseudomonadota bacterium]